MGYYIRILGIANNEIHINEIIDALAKEDLTAQFSLDENETADNWTILNVANSNGENLIQIERNPIEEGELGQEELEEFREDIKEYKPNSAVKWLDKYFNKVKVIYAFQLLDASMNDENFPIVSSIKTTIWNKVGGIFQADGEGFTNEDGYHILWQFADDATGDWNMAIKNLFGNWINFTMDLGDQKQREEFWKGNIPKEARKH
jgi:hypothetical protein